MRSGLLLAVALAACGDNIASLTYEEYRARLHDAVCDRYLRCGALDQAACDRPNFARYPVDPVYAQAIARGSIEWDGVAAAHCLEAYTALSCDRAEDVLEDDCDLGEPQLVDGEACLSHSECISNECWDEPCPSACCVGYCVGSDPQPLSRIGERCGRAECVEGYCSFSGICEPFLGAGEACSFNESSAACGPGQYCNGETCKPPIDHEAACESTDTCRLIADWCMHDTAICERRRGAGAICLVNEECAAGLMCVGNRCAHRTLALGDYCEGDAQCGTPGALCIYSRCELPKPLGDECWNWFECKSQNCNYATSTCIEQCSLDE